MKRYEMKLIPTEGDTMKKKQESLLKDLLGVMPTLKKHKLEGEVHSTIKKLRSGRKTKSYTLELSRKFNGDVIKVQAPVTKINKMQVMIDLKAKIRAEMQKRRLEARPVIDQYPFRQGVTVPRLAEVFLEPGSFYKVMLKKIRQDMNQGKKPKTTDKYLGIEIELAAQEDRNVLCDKIFEAGLGKFVCVKGDSSIQANKGKLQGFPHAHEIAVLCKESELEDVITRLCKVLNEELHCKVDKSCGLHVHVDMRTRDVQKSFHNLVSCQQFLYAMLPAERRSSRYSYPVKGTQWRILPERYHGINNQAFDKYKTLEMRMHCGTTQANKIINWTKMLIAIADAPKIALAPTTVASFAEAAGLNTEIVTYVKTRVAKFAAQHKANIPSSEAPGTMPSIEEVTGAEADRSLAEESEVA